VFKQHNEAYAKKLALQLNNAEKRAEGKTSDIIYQVVT